MGHGDGDAGRHDLIVAPFAGIRCQLTLSMAARVLVLAVVADFHGERQNKDDAAGDHRNGQRDEAVSHRSCWDGHHGQRIRQRSR